MSKESMKMNRRDFLGLGAVARGGPWAWQDARPRLRPRKTSEQLVAQPATPEATAAAEDWRRRARSRRGDIANPRHRLPHHWRRHCLPAAGAAADLGLNHCLR